jgi:hypothetical protein
VKALVTERLTVAGGVGLLSTEYEDASLGLFGYGGQFFPGNGNSFISAPKVDFKSSIARGAGGASDSLGVPDTQSSRRKPTPDIELRTSFL